MERTLVTRLSLKAERERKRGIAQTKACLLRLAKNPPKRRSKELKSQNFRSNPIDIMESIIRKCATVIHRLDHKCGDCKTKFVKMGLHHVEVPEEVYNNMVKVPLVADFTRINDEGQGCLRCSVRHRTNNAMGRRWGAVVENSKRWVEVGVLNNEIRSLKSQLHKAVNAPRDAPMAVQRYRERFDGKRWKDLDSKLPNQYQKIVNIVQGWQRQTNPAIKGLLTVDAPSIPPMFTDYTNIDYRVMNLERSLENTQSRLECTKQQNRNLTNEVERLRKMVMESELKWKTAEFERDLANSAMAEMQQCMKDSLVFQQIINVLLDDCNNPLAESLCRYSFRHGQKIVDTAALRTELKHAYELLGFYQDQIKLRHTPLVMIQRCWETRASSTAAPPVSAVSAAPAPSSPIESSEPVQMMDLSDKPPVAPPVTESPNPIGMVDSPDGTPEPPSTAPIQHIAEHAVIPSPPKPVIEDHGPFTDKEWKQLKSIFMDELGRLQLKPSCHDGWVFVNFIGDQMYFNNTNFVEAVSDRGASDDPVFVSYDFIDLLKNTQYGKPCPNGTRVNDIQFNSEQQFA